MTSIPPHFIRAPTIIPVATSVMRESPEIKNMLLDANIKDHCFTTEKKKQASSNDNMRASALAVLTAFATVARAGTTLWSGSFNPYLGASDFDKCKLSYFGFHRPSPSFKFSFPHNFRWI